MTYNTFPRKLYGAIFVENEEDIQKVKDIIKAMDDFEYEYLPSELIKVFNPNERIFEDGSKHYYIPLCYTHKFDSLDLNELQARCWMAGIHMFCMMDSKEDVWIDELKTEA